MPHRIHFVTTCFSHMVEGSVLAFLTGTQGMFALLDALSAEDWGRITGPHGVAFVACFSTLVLWGTFVTLIRRVRLDALAKETRDRADAHAREERERVDRAEHFKTLHDSNKENVERLIELTEKHQKLTVEAAKVDMRVAHSISQLETAILVMSENFSSCPANPKNQP